MTSPWLPPPYDPTGECTCTPRHSPRLMVVETHHILPLSWSGPNTPSNMARICLPPDEPVLMADGSERAIGLLDIGDQVIGGDGLPHAVTSVVVSPHDGDLAVLDGRSMTLDHPVLTPAGWVPAGELSVGATVGQYTPDARGVLLSEVLRVRTDEPEVFDPVISSVVVDVMDDFSAEQSSAEMLFHDPAVLTHGPTLSVVPDDDDSITLRVKRPLADALHGSRDSLQGRHATVVATEAPSAFTQLGVRYVEGRPALFAGAAAVSAQRPLAASQGTCRRTSPVIHKGLRPKERLAADIADSHHHRRVLTDERGWTTLLHVGRRPYTGTVYDISVCCSRSFVTQGLIVHNCPNTHYGTHALLNEYVRHKGTPPPTIVTLYTKPAQLLASMAWKLRDPSHPTPYWMPAAAPIHVEEIDGVSRVAEMMRWPEATVPRA